MELLKQPLCNPLALHEQVITLWTATQKKWFMMDKKNVKQYQKDLLAYFDNVYPEIGKRNRRDQGTPVMNWEKRSFRLQMSSGIVATK